MGERVEWGSEKRKGMGQVEGAKRIEEESEWMEERRIQTALREERKEEDEWNYEVGGGEME